MSRGLRCAASIAVWTGLTLSAAGQATRVDLSEEALVARAVKYVAGYEKAFAFLLADETYWQRRFGADDQGLQERVMKSELFLTYLPADAEWIAVRDVIDVDGVLIPDRANLQAMLATRHDARGLIGQIIQRNARYNIGRIERNFNEPTLPLLLLGARRVGGVGFDRKQVVREGERTTVVLSFEERDRPTLVGSARGPVRGRGEFLIDAETGTILKTTFELSPPNVRARLETVYKPDEKLGLWLPATFTERYETTGALREVVTAEATYANYRRFEVTARIK